MKSLLDFQEQIKKGGSAFSAPRHQIVQTDVMIELLVEIRDLLDKIAHGPADEGEQ